MEQWKIYKVTCRGTYKISNYGRVMKNDVIVEPYVNGNYLMYANISIHRAVAELFIPNPENKPYVDHIDNHKFNNHYTNLRWVTPKENANNELTKKHLSEVANPWNKGGKMSEESKAKMSKAFKGKTWKVVDGKRVWYDE